MSAQGPINTPLTKLFGIKHPILLAGMNVAAGPALAAAVTNAGGLGVIGGLGYSPNMLREQIDEIKENLTDKNAPFGIDLLLPQVGEGARKTNYDYTKGKLGELVDVVIESGAKLFVSAVGVPPKQIVDKLHAAKIPVMNMVGHPKHCEKAIAAGVDIICAQGGEGGGHTGHVPTSILIPRCVEICNKHKSKLTGDPVYVVAAGGVYSGKSLAAALMYGAQAVWVGTRFICAKEAGAPKAHQKAVITADYDDTIRTIIFTGRPLRVKKNPYIMNWEENRADEIKELTSEGKIPAIWELEQYEKMQESEAEAKERANEPEKKKVERIQTKVEDNMEEEEDVTDGARPWLMGNVAAVINDVKPAKEIVDEIVTEAVSQLQLSSKLLARI